MPYPQIIIYNEEIEIAHQPSDVDDFLYGMSKDEQKRVKVLKRNGNYSSLFGGSCQALTATELGLCVKHYLANEGQCCLSKIEQLTPQQAFSLLTLS